MDVVAQQIIAAVSLGGVYALLALGLAIIFSVLGMINFAHGEIMTLAGYAIAFSIAALGFPFALAVLAAAMVAGVAAVVVERVAFRPVRNASLSTMLLTTFAVSSILQVLYQNFISPRPVAVAVPSRFTEIVSVFGLAVGTIQLVSIATTLVVLVGLVVFLKRAVLGIAMRAAAQDFAVTRLMGIDANRVIAVAFCLSGVLAGLSGFIWVAQRGSVDPLMGFLPVLKAFIAVVIGGLGSLPGAVLGAFLLGALEVGLRANLPQDLLPFREAIALSAVILLLLVRPEGLLGTNNAVR